MVSLWNARSYLKELKTNLKSSQSAPVFLLPRLTSLHYKFFAQSPPPAQASAPPPMPPTPPGGSKGSHHSCHRPDSPAQRLDGATTLKWRLTTNTGWRHLLIVDSRSKQRKSRSLITKSMEDFVRSKRPLRKYARIRTLTADLCCFKAETNTTL